MAKKRVVTSGVSQSTVVLIVVVAVVAFAVGFFVAKDRYMDKISAISQMHMEKAVTIDNLHRQIQVLGASTEAE